jgi:S-layer protein (TIGR01567 family)
LEGGYELKIVQLDFPGGKVQLELLRDGQSVSTDIVNVPDTFVYVTDIGELDDVPVIAVHINSIFTGQPDTVVIDGVFQISEDYISVEAGDIYGKMVTGGVSGDVIAMTNAYQIHLSRGDMINLMGNIWFVVADNEALRFSPVVKRTAPGTYEVRGAVARPDVDLSNGFVWNASNFAALWYDFDSGASTETLTIESLNRRVIEDDMLTYTTRPVYQQYAINKAYDGVMIGGATGYNAAGWITEKHVAANGRADTLSRLLVEFKGDDKKTLAVGEPWDLGAGFTLTAMQIDLESNKVWLTFARDGLEIDSEVIDTSPSGSSNQDRTFIAYLEDMDGDEEIAVFHCYVDAIFRGTDTNIVQVTHVFLIDNFCTKISTGDIYGAMEVIRADSDEIVLANRVMPTILEPGSRQRVMGNMYLRTADNETEIRFYPAAEYTIGRDEPPGYPGPEV